MKKKFVLFVFLVIMLVFGDGSLVLAQEASLRLEQSQPLVGSTGVLINYMEGTITQSGSNTVALSVSTSTNCIVNSLTQTMYLQKLSGSSWVTVNNFTKSAYNTNCISDFKSSYVDIGSIYRLLAVAKATTSTTDIREAYSNPITIQ